MEVCLLIVDDTQMIKKGSKSVGVAPQHCGSTNQIENCQVVVMLTYAAAGGHAYIGHRLYPRRAHQQRLAATRAVLTAHAGDPSDEAGKGAHRGNAPAPTLTRARKPFPGGDS